MNSYSGHCDFPFLLCFNQSCLHYSEEERSCEKKIHSGRRNQQVLEGVRPSIFSASVAERCQTLVAAPQDIINDILTRPLFTLQMESRDIMLIIKLGVVINVYVDDLFTSFVLWYECNNS
jgi:hypothetical protein